MCRAQLQRPVKRHAGGIVTGHRRPVKTGHRCRACGRRHRRRRGNETRADRFQYHRHHRRKRSVHRTESLLAAESVTGVKPRILGVPGLDTKEVAVALVSVCQKLRAFGYISAWGCKTISEVKAYRQNFSQRELMVIWPDFLAWDTVTSTTATAYATARALGLRAKIDRERGWHKTLSNVGVNGVTGISASVFWICRSPAPMLTCLTSQASLR